MPTLALRSMDTNAPSESPAWTPPSTFDVVKELNAHAGRLGAVLSISIALVVLSVSTGPVHDALVRPYRLTLVVAFVALGVTFAMTVLYLQVALHPSVAIPIDDQAEWARLVDLKARECDYATRGLGVIVALLAIIWLSTFVEPESLNDLLIAVGLFVSTIVVGVALKVQSWRRNRARRAKTEQARQLDADGP